MTSRTDRMTSKTEKMVVAIKDVTLENLQQEHICCAIGAASKDCGLAAKKTWLSERMAEGLAFKKLDARGKVFIEYLPAEVAWAPIVAEGYMYVNCFWVSGAFKGNGHANRLLEACIADAKGKGKKGLVVLSSKKKMPFLSDPKYLKYKGFRLADTAAPYFELLYLPFEGDAADEQPRFLDCCRTGTLPKSGYVLYYSHQCPHTAKYAPLVAELAKSKGVDFELIHIADAAAAKAAPSPFTTYALFKDGHFVTNEILSDTKFLKMLEEASEHSDFRQKEVF